MRILIVVSALLLAACPKSESKPDTSSETKSATKPRQPREIPKPRASDTPFEKVWKNVAKSTNGCDAFDYFPDGGMRNMSCHLKTILSYSELGKLGPKVWRAGPHGAVRLDLNSEDDFGRYDPAFVTWLAENAVPAATKPAFKEVTQPIYDKFFSNLATVYLRAAIQLERNPQIVEREKAYLLAYIGKPEGKRPLDRLGDLEPPNMYNLYAPALAFWIRRHVDGTAKDWEKGLRVLVETYDPQALRETSAQDLKVPAPGDDDPTVVADGSLDQMVRAAWKALPNAKYACKDQFEYDPGGARVAYCWVSSLLRYPAVKAKMPVFEKGPHGADIDYDSERTFGHYDPRFVQWLADYGVPAEKDAALRAATQPFYDRRFKIAVRAFYAARLKLTDDPTFAVTEKKKYERFVAEGGDKPYWGYWEHMPGIYEAQAIGGTGIAFWLRRSMDGTDQLFTEVIEKLLRAYDRGFLEDANRLRFDGLSKRPELFGETPDLDHP